MKSHKEFARERMKVDELKAPRKYAELFKGESSSSVKQRIFESNMPLGSNKFQSEKQDNLPVILKQVKKRLYSGDQISHLLIRKGTHSSTFLSKFQMSVNKVKVSLFCLISQSHRSPIRTKTDRPELGIICLICTFLDFKKDIQNDPKWSSESGLFTELLGYLQIQLNKLSKRVKS